MLNGGTTEVGDFSLIASGAVLLENAKVPPYTFMVGVPAEVKGMVSEDQVSRFKLNAERYVELGQQYKAEEKLNSQTEA